MGSRLYLWHSKFLLLTSSYWTVSELPERIDPEDEIAQNYFLCDHDGEQTVESAMG